MSEHLGTATYSPEDDKLRFTAFRRLSPEDYAKVKALGFGWAPKQGCFYAVWTPGREDFLIEACGEIEDDDKSLLERAEDRSERFTVYSEHRAADAERADKAAHQIMDMIPFGQPILVGHHSEGRARRDFDRIHNNLGKAVKNWETSAYWSSRAAAAIAHAKYKERPDVRARRIKKLEAELRKQKRNDEENKLKLSLWEKVSNLEQAKFVANHDSLPLPQGDERGWSLWSALDNGKIDFETAKAYAIEARTEFIPGTERWISHLENRLTYERAMLADSGGTEADKVKPEVGGACKCWASPQGGFSYIVKVNKVSVSVLDNWGNGGENFLRKIEFDKLHDLKTKAEVDALRAEDGFFEDATKRGFYLKVKGVA